jgi:hypothetical protein
MDLETHCQEQHAPVLSVISNLLSLEQCKRTVQKNRPEPGFSFAQKPQLLILQYFSRNPFRLNILQTLSPAKRLILDILAAK